MDSYEASFDIYSTLPLIFSDTSISSNTCFENCQAILIKMQEITKIDNSYFLAMRIVCEW